MFEFVFKFISSAMTFTTDINKNKRIKKGSDNPDL